MPAGHFVAIALLAQVAGAAPADPAPAVPAPAVPGRADPAPTAAASVSPTYGPVLPAPPKPPVKTTVSTCAPAHVSADTREIVVCAQKPQGYRLDPDVMEAKREKHSGGRPKRPDRMRDNSCASVGPAGCIGAGAGIDLLGAAMVLGTMATKAVKGENVGKMFVTDPQPTEYQLYVEAKRRREAKEAEAAAAAKAKAAQAAKAAGQAEAAKAEPSSGASSPQPKP
jgi:hypothetical protein